MRVCFFSHCSPAASGTGVYARNLPRELAALGHEVTLIWRCHHAPPPEIPGARVLGLAAPAEPAQPASGFDRDTETMVQIAVAEHGKSPFDLLHALDVFPSGPAALETSRRLDLPNVVSVHGHDDQRDGIDDSAIHQGVTRAVLGHASAVLIDSRFLAGRLHADYGVPPDRLTVVPGAVDTVRFSPRQRYFAGQWIDAAQPVLLYHGCVDRRHGALDLLDAFALLRQRRHPVALRARLLYSGVGPDGVVVKGKVNQLGLNQAFTNLGAVDPGNLPNVYRAADIFISPTRLERSPDAILEAMSAGLPVVSSKVAGVVDCVLDGINGLLVPPGSVAALANALARLFDEQLLRMRLSERARREVHAGYSWPAVARRIAGAYAQVRPAASGDSRAL